MLYSVVKTKKKYYLQRLLEECKYDPKKIKMENLISDHLEKISSDKSDSESHDEASNENDNETESDSANESENEPKKSSKKSGN